MKGYKAFIKGLTHNHFCQYEQAAKELVSSLEYFKNGSFEEHLIKPITALSKIYLNLKDDQRIEKYHKLFLTFKDKKSTSHQILDLEYQIYIALLKEDANKGILLLKDLKTKFKSHIERSFTTYLVLDFTLHIQIEDYDRCYEILEEYKHTSGFKMRYNYFFMLSLLNYITKNASIYAYKKDYK